MKLPRFDIIIEYTVDIQNNPKEYLYLGNNNSLFIIKLSKWEKGMNNLLQPNPSFLMFPDFYHCNDTLGSFTHHKNRTFDQK